jgi:hypothetical protein
MTTEPNTQQDSQGEDTTRYTLTDLGQQVLGAVNTRTSTDLAALPADGPPADNPYAGALWLVSRHPQLAELARRIPGVHGHDSQGPWLDLDLLADAINAYDDDQPDNHTHAGAALYQFARLPRSEQARLRLLATLGWSPVRIRVGMLSAFDDTGQALIDDWFTAMRAS